MPVETLSSSRLYQVQPPPDGSTPEERAEWTWPRTSGNINVDDLSAPENWWWLNDENWQTVSQDWHKAFGWDESGCAYIRVRRNGNAISCWTTKFSGSPPSEISRNGIPGDFGGVYGPSSYPSSDAEWDTAVVDKNAYLLTVDLNSEDTIPNTSSATFRSKFSGKRGQIGFFASSQAGASFDIIQWNMPRMFVRTDLNQLIEYDPLDGQYKVIDKLPVDFCGRGRLCKNLATNKTFYVGDASFIKVAEPASSGGFNARVVDQMPADPDPNTYYFVTN